MMEYLSAKYMSHSPRLPNSSRIGRLGEKMRVMETCSNKKDYLTIREL